MASETEIAVLFADVVGSTELYEALGDIKARDTIAHCIEAMKLATEQHGGRVIKTIGDEVMSTFPSADDALNAAREMQMTISRGNLPAAEGVPLAIRVGCDFGPVIPDERDVFGATVHTANRMTSQAKAYQIVTTSDMVEHLSAEWRASVRQIDLAHVKGRSGEIALYEVLWQKEDITSMLPTINWAEETKAKARMRLRYQGEEVLVDARRPQANIGRAEDNQLVIKGNLVSRLHCRVEMSRDRFLLVDQSTNGTFVITRQGEELFVRRDSIQLGGEGVIGLGRVVQAGSAQAIHFIEED